MPKAIARMMSAELRLFVIRSSITAIMAAGTIGRRNPHRVCSLRLPIISMINAVNMMIATLAASEGWMETP